MQSLRIDRFEAKVQGDGEVAATGEEVRPILVAPLLLPLPSNLPFPLFLLLFHATVATESDARDHAAPAGPPLLPVLPLPRRPRKLVRCASATPRRQQGNGTGEGRPAAADAVLWASAGAVVRDIRRPEGSACPRRGGRGRRRRGTGIRPFGRWGTGCEWTGDKGRVGWAGAGAGAGGAGAGAEAEAEAGAGAGAGGAGGRDRRRFKK